MPAVESGTKAMLWIVFVVFLVTLDAALANATPVTLVGAPNTTNCCFYPLGLSTERAVQFSLSGNEFVTTIDLTLVDFAPDAFALTLVNALTGPATVYGSFNLTGTNSVADAQTVTLNKNLLAGTYFLVLTSGLLTGGIGDGWLLSDGTLVQNAGTVANGEWMSVDSGTTWSFDNNATTPFCNNQCFPGVFDVKGTAAAPVPEPATIMLFGTGLVATVSRVRRHRSTPTMWQ